MRIQRNSAGTVLASLQRVEKYFLLLTWQHARRTVAGTPEDCRYSCGQHSEISALCEIRLTARTQAIRTGLGEHFSSHGDTHRHCGLALEVGHQAARRHLLQLGGDALLGAWVLQAAPHQVLDAGLGCAHGPKLAGNGYAGWTYVSLPKGQPWWFKKQD